MEAILTDKDIITKFEKAFAQMSTACRTFSKIFGLVANKLEPIQQPVSPKVTQIEPVEINQKTWEKELKPWFDNRNVFSVHHAVDIAKFAIGDRYRGDKFKNVWKMKLGVLEPSTEQIRNKQNWKKISMQEIDKLYKTYCFEFEDLQEHVRKRLESNELGKCHRSKQIRINHVLESTPISYNAFSKIIRDNHNNHDKFPPFRS